MGIGWLGTLVFFAVLLASAWLRTVGPGWTELPAVAIELFASVGLLVSFVAAIIIPFIGRR